MQSTRVKSQTFDVAQSQINELGLPMIYNIMVTYNNLSTTRSISSILTINIIIFVTICNQSPPNLILLVGKPICNKAKCYANNSFGYEIHLTDNIFLVIYDFVVQILT